VVRLVDDGVVVDLGDDIEGFVPRSQVPMGDRKELHEVLAEGQAMGLRVLECDAANRRIVLAVTQMPERPTAAQIAAAAAAAAPSGEEAAAAPVEAMAAPAAEEEGTETRAPVEATAEGDIER
jgi:small subunit ribosomal protein S1